MSDKELILLLKTQKQHHNNIEKSFYINTVYQDNIWKGLTVIRNLIGEIPCELRIKTILMLLIFTAWHCYLSSSRLIMDPHNNQLLVALIAQLVEHCTRIADFRVEAQFRPEFFSPTLSYLVPSCYCLSSIDKLQRT